MKSPFPGMDPFIEGSGLWEDFHDDLIAEIKRVLAERLPRGYLVRTRKRAYGILAEGEGASTPYGVQIEPLSLRAFIDTEFEEKLIDVYEVKPERRLVTSVELLSPSNKKRGSVGWKKYLRKRQALLLGKASLVEIDLLRGG